jgi:hypothetical protein
MSTRSPLDEVNPRMLGRIFAVALARLTAAERCGLMAYLTNSISAKKRGARWDELLAKALWFY